MRGCGGGKKVAARCHVNEHLSLAEHLCCYVTRSSRFRTPPHLFEAVTRHIGRTVGRNTTVLSFVLSPWEKPLSFYNMICDAWPEQWARAQRKVLERSRYHVDHLWMLARVIDRYFGFRHPFTLNVTHIQEFFDFSRIGRTTESCLRWPVTGDCWRQWSNLLMTQSWGRHK